MRRFKWLFSGMFLPAIFFTTVTPELQTKFYIGYTIAAGIGFLLSWGGCIVNWYKEWSPLG